MRLPVVSGMFYPDSFEELTKTLKDCFLHGKGPATLPSKRKDKIAAVIAPHAGYQYSGQCAAWAYKELAEAEYPDLFVILCPDHSGLGGKVSVSMEDWRTPLGVVRNDTRFARELLKRYGRAF